MKKLMMLMLASGFVATPSFAARDTATPNCQQVIQSIQEQLKKTRPVVDTAAPTGTPDRPAAIAQ